MELEAGEESDRDILLFCDEPAFLVSKWLKHAVSHLEQYLTVRDAVVETLMSVQMSYIRRLRSILLALIPPTSKVLE